ncbi:hypothetical protein AAMO2058_000872600 [Amorphochlora amoebiformis]
MARGYVSIAVLCVLHARTYSLGNNQAVHRATHLPWLRHSSLQSARKGGYTGRNPTSEGLRLLGELFPSRLGPHRLKINAKHAKKSLSNRGGRGGGKGGTGATAKRTSPRAFVDRRLRKMLKPYGVSEKALETLESQFIVPEIAMGLTDTEFQELNVQGNDLILVKKALGKLQSDDSKIVTTFKDLTKEEIDDDLVREQILANDQFEEYEESDEDLDSEDWGRLSEDIELDVTQDDAKPYRVRAEGSSIFADGSTRFSEEDESDSFEDDDTSNPLTHIATHRAQGADPRKEQLRATGASQYVDPTYEEIDPQDIDEFGSEMMEELRSMGVVRKALPGLPKPGKIRISQSTFAGTSKSIHYCPPPRYVEFAVIGRSNVGKSSLINALTGNKKLAEVSKQPGKTRSINHYLIDDSWYLVDLPGYGYAKVAMTERFGWHKATQQYFTKRPTLALVMLLIDSSIPPQKIDLECANWLGEAQVPFMLVFTKVDKSKKGYTMSLSYSPNPKTQNFLTPFSLSLSFSLLSLSLSLFSLSLSFFLLPLYISLFLSHLYLSLFSFSLPSLSNPLPVSSLLPL